MTATDGPNLFTEFEDDTDVDIADYDGLTDGHHVCNCGTCGRLLLARRHAKERHDNLYGVADGNKLPPVLYRKRVVVAGRVTRAVPLCKACYDDPEAVVPVGYAV